MIYSPARSTFDQPNEAPRLDQVEAGAADIDLIGGFPQTAPLGRIE
jgi:hypothetical protein